MASRRWACQCLLTIAVLLLLSSFAPVHAQSDDLAALNRRIGQLFQAGKYDEAIPLAQRLVELTKTRFGNEHRTHADALGILGDLYREKGRYAEAEPLYKSARSKLEKALGPDHREVGRSLNRLALLYWAQGRYAAAEPLYKRALAIDEKALGADDPAIGTLLNNHAVLHVRQGRYAEAEPLYHRAIAIAEKALGPDHPDVGRALAHLALLYSNQGRYAEAERLYKRALAIRETALGPNHPEVAGTLNSLALLYVALVVHFATHGLVGSEAEMLGASKAEPALLLTPPNQPSEEDDGLLTASEAALLKLDADWVVLSACNTAAGDSKTGGAEALSGLARAFFYAGARALLVSHWAVDSNATVSLIAKAFDEIKSDSRIGRAEALRRSMLALIGTGGGNAHPATWAPFVVVGEGAH